MQHPVFVKYRRTWLSETTGYSKGYLCRVATGKILLTQYFIERVAYSLRQHPTELFLPEVLRDSDWRRHQEKKRANATRRSIYAKSGGQRQKGSYAKAQGD